MGFNRSKMAVMFRLSYRGLRAEAERAQEATEGNQVRDGSALTGGSGEAVLLVMGVCSNQLRSSCRN